MPAQTFCLPFKRLENDRIALVPFESDVHSEMFMSRALLHPDLFKYVPLPLFTSAAGFKSFIQENVDSNPSELLFIMLDKDSEGRDGDVAGIISLIGTSLDHAATEIGIVVLPEFQRTHISTNAIGLLLQYTLDPPPSGLGMRRVQWQANAANQPSTRTAERLGFQYEMTQRWQRVVPDHVAGNDESVENLPEFNGKKLGKGRHTAVYSMCWDDWIEKRGMVAEMMKRRD